jgi:acetyl esterase/lipase
MAKLGYDFGAKDFMVVAADHRGYPDEPYPQDIQDVFCALAWVFENADKYAIDPEQIFLVGYSSGGTQAAQVATFTEPSRYLEDCPYIWPDRVAFAGVVTVTGIFDYPYTLETSPLIAE